MATAIAEYDPIKFVNPALPQPAPTLPESLDLIIAGVCQAMAEQCGVDSFIAPLCVLLWVRLFRTATRFQLQFDRWREGRLPATRPPASRPPNSRKRPKLEQKRSALGQAGFLMVPATPPPTLTCDTDAQQ